MTMKSENLLSREKDYNIICYCCVRTTHQ